MKDSSPFKRLPDLWSEFIGQVRSFFREKGYTEVSTPLLLEHPNLDPNVEPVELRIKERGSERRVWLQTSPEPRMKKLLARYGKDIFQITKVFRNNEWGKFHSLEFHMLEWYAVGCDYRYLIVELRQLLEKVLGIKEAEVLSVEELFLREFGEPPPEDEEAMREFLKKRGMDFSQEENWETLFFRAFVEVERKLGREKPLFLVDFPERLAALARVRNGKAERVELFFRGVELANGWTEERNPGEVRRRLQKEAKKRGLPLDEEFVKVHGEIPPCAGCSLGLDRLFMFYVGASSLREVEL